jgi:Flp pilus assembly protein TadG
MTNAAFRDFAGDRRANVGLIFAFMALPLVFTIGMAIDYGAAARLKSKLNAAADAAVLAAVTPAMMAQSNAAAATAATNMFEAQIVGLPRLIFTPNNLTVTVTQTVGSAGTTRNVTVAYAAQSQNAFGGVLNMSSLAFGGTSSGSATTPANINFYLLLDSSPSMGIAGTPTGITTMVNATQSQGGCAFACHQANPAADNLGNPGGEDNYALSKALNVTLRTDLLDAAITDLTNTAYSAQTNPSLPVQPAYQMSINSFDSAFHQLVPLTSSYVSAWSTQLSAMKANSTQFLEVYSNNNACGNAACTFGVANSDADTSYDAAMRGITALMPTPGNGTNQPGDTPREILFIVTDGVEDENVAGNRQQSTMTGSQDWCTPLKNKGIEIAILYTEYFPLPTNSWYNTYIAPIQPSIGTTLQSCASSGLFYEVGMGQDISAALTTLFQSAVASAHLTQ